MYVAIKHFELFGSFKHFTVGKGVAVVCVIIWSLYAVIYLLSISVLLGPMEE